MELLVIAINYKIKTFLTEKYCLKRNNHLFVFDVNFIFMKKAISFL